MRTTLSVLFSGMTSLLVLTIGTWEKLFAVYFLGGFDISSPKGVTETKSVCFLPDASTKGLPTKKYNIKC